MHKMSVNYSVLNVNVLQIPSLNFLQFYFLLVCHERE